MGCVVQSWQMPRKLKSMNLSPISYQPMVNSNLNFRANSNTVKKAVTSVHGKQGTSDLGTFVDNLYKTYLKRAEGLLEGKYDVTEIETRKAIEVIEDFENQLKKGVELTPNTYSATLDKHLDEMLCVDRYNRDGYFKRISDIITNGWTRKNEFQNNFYFNSGIPQLRYDSYGFYH